MLNKAMIIGRLGQDPEIKVLQSGSKLCTISVATDYSYKDRNGEPVKTTEWHKIVLWRNLAEIAERFLKKGQMAYFEGRIEYKSVEIDGDTKYYTQIVCDELKLLSPKKDANDEKTEGAEVYKTEIPTLTDEVKGEDDLPF